MLPAKGFGYLICPICFAEFKRKTLLVDHMRGVHSIGEPFVCSCGLKFKSRPTRDRHRRKCRVSDPDVSAGKAVLHNANDETEQSTEVVLG